MIEIQIEDLKGKLYLCGPQDAGLATPMKGAHLCITRGKIVPGMEKWQHRSNTTGETKTLLEALAPSAELIFDFWNKSAKDDAAFAEYLKRWMIEKSNNMDYDRALCRIWEIMQAGNDVFLSCWCRDKSKCHVTIVAADLTNLMGVADWGIKRKEVFPVPMSEHVISPIPGILQCIHCGAYTSDGTQPVHHPTCNPDEPEYEYDDCSIPERSEG